MKTYPEPKVIADGTGSGSLTRREPVGQTPYATEQSANSGFQELEQPVGGLPGKLDMIFQAKGGSLYGVKEGAHAHDRMEERTPFHKSYVNQLQLAVDSLGLEGAQYHLPLRHQNGTVAGYAQFKKVPNRKYPVLATVLGPAMKPGGVNIETMLKTSSVLEMLGVDVTSGVDTDVERGLRPRGAGSNRVNTHTPSSQEPQQYTIKRTITDLRHAPGATLPSENTDSLETMHERP